METITLCTHNVNGYHRSKECLKRRCGENDNLIYALQETWLKPPYKKHLGVNELRSLHPNYEGYGVSSMTTDRSIRKGRPYGGTGFLFPKCFSVSIKPCPLFKSERVSVIMLQSKPKNILCVNTYFPYYSTSSVNDQVLSYKETLAHVESVLENNRDCEFVLLADVNCNYYNLNHQFTKLLREMLERWNMISCFDIDKSVDHNALWTRHEFKKCRSSPSGKIEHRSFLDGIFLSNNLSSSVKEVRISYDGDNVSDHYPVEVDLCIALDSCHAKTEVKQPFIKWSKIPKETFKGYSELMEHHLDEIIPHPDVILHGSVACSNCDHFYHLESYYLSIIDAVAKADAILPRSYPQTQRDFWSSNLTNLKKQSIESCKLWRENGQPPHGPIHDEKVRCHLVYKKELRKAKTENLSNRDSRMHDDLQSKNDRAFWKT